MGILRAPIDYAIAQETNDSNELIARMNNKTAIQLWREQMEHDLDMWNKENEYNTPVQQMERLKDAGINPFALMEGSGNFAGNASGSAGGQLPPSMQSAVMQPPQFSTEGIDQLANAFKSVKEGVKTGVETDITAISSDWFKELSLNGVNPELIKSSVMLQQYNNMKKQGKYIPDYMEATIKNLGTSSRVNDAIYNVRVEEAEKIKKEAEALGISNKFNSELFPQQIAKISQDMKIEWEQHQKNLQIGDSVVALNQANAGQSNAAADLINQQKDTEFEKTIQERFKAELAKIGINPNASNLPFFAGLAAKLMSGQVKPFQVSQYFDLLKYAEDNGVERLGKSNKNLSIFELWNSPSGMFGTGINVNTLKSSTGFKQLEEMFNNLGSDIIAR